jgi:thiol-disulfide isomerase/thioredoxin
MHIKQNRQTLQTHLFFRQNAGTALHRTLLAGMGATLLLLNSGIPVLAKHELPAPYKPATPCESVLLEFHWNKCAACKAIEPYVEELRTRGPAVGLSVKVIDVYAPANTPLNQAFDVNAVPAFFLFGGNGEELGAYMAGSIGGQELPEAVLKQVATYRQSQGCKG